MDQNGGGELSWNIEPYRTSIMHILVQYHRGGWYTNYGYVDRKWAFTSGRNRVPTHDNISVQIPIRAPTCRLCCICLLVEIAMNNHRKIAQICIKHIARTDLRSKGRCESSVALAFVLPHAGRAKSHTLRIGWEAVKHLKSVWHLETVPPDSKNNPFSRTINLKVNFVPVTKQHLPRIINQIQKPNNHPLHTPQQIGESWLFKTGREGMEFRLPWNRMIEGEW